MTQSLTAINMVERFLFVRRVERVVPCATAIYLCRSAGHGKVFDQVFSLSEFLFFKTEDGTDAF